MAMPRSPSAAELITKAHREPGHAQANGRRQDFADAVHMRFQRFGQQSIGKLRPQVAPLGGDHCKTQQAGDGVGPHGKALGAEDAVAQEFAG